MHLAIWIFLLMFVTSAARGYDDERILERLAERQNEEEEEGIEAEQQQQQQQPHHQQQRGGWRGGIRGEGRGEGRGGGGRGGGGGGRTPVSSSAANHPAPSLIPDSVHWKEDDYDSPASSSSLRRGGRGRTPGSSSSRQSSSAPPPPHAVALTDEPWRAAASPPSSRPQPQPSHHLRLPSASSVSDDDSQEQPRRHKTSQRGRLNGSRGLVAHSVCPSQTEWKKLRDARDINGTVVEVFQPSHGGGGGGGGGQRRQGGRGGGGGGDGLRWTQWFYVVSCRNHVFQSERQCENCCIGIDHARYTSSCEQRQSYVMAYIRRPWQKRFSWDYILINSGCSCAITSIHEDL